MPRRWRAASTAAPVAFLITVVVAVVVVSTPAGKDRDEESRLGVSSGLTRFDGADRKPAPSIEGPSLTGSELVSISHPGRVVVVNVWQSTCGPCRGEADALEAAAKSTASESTFVGLDVVDQRAAAQAFLRTSGSTYPHVYDPDAQQLLKFNGILPVQAIPSTAVIDEQGRIAARVIGPVSARTLTQLIDEVSSST